MVDKAKIAKLRQENMFAARSWLDNAIPYSNKTESVSILGIVSVVVRATLVCLMMLLIVTPAVQ
jgi:hypothetical protein